MVDFVSKGKKKYPGSDFFFLSWDKINTGKGDVVTNTTFPAYLSQNQPNVRKLDITAEKLALNLFPRDALVGNRIMLISVYKIEIQVRELNCSEFTKQLRDICFNFTTVKYKGV